jgi:hypothetical protein
MISQRSDIKVDFNVAMIERSVFDSIFGSSLRSIVSTVGVCSIFLAESRSVSVISIVSGSSLFASHNHHGDVIARLAIDHALGQYVV